MIDVIITLYLKDRLLNFRLPTSISGSYSFYCDENENTLINIEAQNGKWVLYALDDISIYYNQKQVESVPLIDNEYYVIKKDNELFLIYTAIPMNKKY